LAQAVCAIDMSEQPIEPSWPSALVVSGAGTLEANGIYKVTSRTYTDAPVYEHIERPKDLKITREPHVSQKTGKVKHGWLIGLQSTPLYGAPTESLEVPLSGWKAFSGVLPLPELQRFNDLDEMFSKHAEEHKALGDAAAEKQQWTEAERHFSTSLNDMKRLKDQKSEEYFSRAAVLLSRRAHAHTKLEAWRHAARDAIAALECAPGLTSAEVSAKLALRCLGLEDAALQQKLLSPLGSREVLDPTAPLVLACVERWLKDALECLQEHGLKVVSLPQPLHMAADRYFDQFDEKTREEIIKKYFPEKPDGGVGTMQTPGQCLQIMREWEQVFRGQNYQKSRLELWENRTLGYSERVQAFREMISAALGGVLEEHGYKRSLAGLDRIIKHMQVHWSADMQCARKAEELEELADISLADLQLDY